jgi:hypothetical protein
MCTTAMQIEFSDLVRRDYVHDETLAVMVPLLGVALVMQAAVWVWAMYLTRDEREGLWPSA